MNKTQLTLQNGEVVNAASPVIISASRATDIPSFYSDWFINRLKEGYVKWINPFNNTPYYVSFDKTRLVVFWTKNPKPLLSRLNYFDDNNINYYFQYTLNDYDNENYEKFVPSINKRIDTFIDLSERIGKEKVIWRFDPLFLTDKVSPDTLLERIENIGNQLYNHTKKLIISFADISRYKKVSNNLRNNNVNYIEFDDNSMNYVANGILELNKKWNLEVSTCAEKINLEQYNITHNKCIDDDLIIKLFKHDKQLMDFLGVKVFQPNQLSPFETIIKSETKKDNGQRELCGCMKSKDIGSYNTCPHGCVYCYANNSFEIAYNNYKSHNSLNDEI